MTVPGIGAPTAAQTEASSIISSRFDELVATWPVLGTALGIHAQDGRLADMSREAKEADLDRERRFVGRLEAFDRDALGPRDAFELDVALHGARRRVFEAEVRREWQRRGTACEEIGDGLFLLLARDFAPLRDRLEPITSRLEAAPRVLVEARDRLGERPVRLWNEMELAVAQSLPTLFDQILAAGRATWPQGHRELRRLERADLAARGAIDAYETWLTGELDRSTDDWALGSVDLDELIRLRDLDGLSADDILAMGLEQLEIQHEARRAAGREIDPGADEMTALGRVKADGPTDFASALVGYRDAMLRARDFVVEHGLATIPTDEVLEVIATPEYLRGVIPFAAYFPPPAFDRPMRGVYVVTPSVDGDPRAMLEHSWSSIVNTSIHEAFPGHHTQLSAALATPTPARLLLEAPELVEGWGMYCEQMMREHGFEAGPDRRVILATDAIWRAARIVLDIRLHRGEIDVPQAIDFLVSHTGFERPNATVEIHRYTRSPTYNLSYLLGKLLILRLREDERRRLGDAFSLRRFHDALLYSGSLPISFHRRLLRGEGGGPTMPESSRGT